MPNPLAPILAWYQVNLDSLRITQRVLTKGIDHVVLVKHKSLHGADPKVAGQRIEAAKEDLARLTVLDLAAVFERTVRLFLLEEYGKAFVGGTPLLDAILAESKVDIEFWNVSERLLAVFPGIDPRIRGNVKQVVEYRNWVAHGKRIDQQAPTNVTPEDAFQRLTAFLDQLGLVTP